MKLYLEKTFTAEKIKREILEPGSTFLIAYDQKNIAGFMRLRTGHEPPELKSEKPLEIERIYATKPYIGKFVGKLLMDEAFVYAREHKFSTVWLGVWEHNLRAIRFYEKTGFEKFSDHVFMLGTDAQTDLLMKKNIE
jgi:ribosomal protein S18 acetylase RimI-like enzyme